jgi:hypothetical protein
MVEKRCQEWLCIDMSKQHVCTWTVKAHIYSFCLAWNMAWKKIWDRSEIIFRVFRFLWILISSIDSVCKRQLNRLPVRVLWTNLQKHWMRYLRKFWVSVRLFIEQHWVTRLVEYNVIVQSELFPSSQVYFEHGSTGPDVSAPRLSGLDHWITRYF